MKRRGHGEGTIRQRSDGRWEATLSLGFDGGKRKRKSYYGVTQAEVLRKLKEAHGDVAENRPLPNERLLLKEFLLHQWLPLVKPTLRPRTFESYRETVALHIAPMLGQIPLAKLATTDVQRLVNQKVDERKLSATSIIYIRNVLRAALNHARRWRLVKYNVADDVTLPASDDSDIRPLDEAQAPKLLEHAKGHRFEALFTVAVALGLRKGEILGLRWTDLDLDDRRVRVVRALHAIKGDLPAGWERLTPTLTLGPVKTRRSQRELELRPFAVAALRAHRARQLEHRLAAGGDWKDHGLVFATSLGTPIVPRNLTRSLKALLKKAGLPTTTRFHDLRHSCGTLLHSQGVPARAIAEVLGHTQLRTTERYTHATQAMVRDAAERMEKLLGGFEDRRRLSWWRSTGGQNDPR
jgi:integrase